jgi:Ras-related protein Rab-7A
MYLFKVVIAGDGGVGKTTLVKRFLLGQFDNTVKLTVGADFFVKKVEVDEKNVTLQIWDFAGEERFRFLLPQYVTGSSGAIFMFDITRYTSIKNYNDWLEIFRDEYSTRGYSNGTLPIMMVGGKKDLEEKRSIKESEAKEIVSMENLCKYMECSAKTGENVEYVFKEFCRELLKRMDES